MAHEVKHLPTLAWAFNGASWARFYRREGQAACALADEAIALSTTQDFPHWLAMGQWMRGQALIELGQWEEGTIELRQGLDAYQATGALLGTRGCGCTEVAKGYGNQGQIAEGLQRIGEALVGVNQVRHYEAEMYRIKGTLTFQSKTSLKQVKGKSKTSLKQVSSKSQASQDKSETTNPQPLTPSTQAEAKPKRVFSRPSTLPVSSRRSRWSCVRQ